MSAELFSELEEKVISLLHAFNELKLENDMLKEENARLQEERGTFRTRIDSILQRLEGV